VIAALPNKVVKWHPDRSCRDSRVTGEIAACTP
jgi:hypothetical protein